jgi:hypothetical protein
MKGEKPEIGTRQRRVNLRGQNKSEEPFKVWQSLKKKRAGINLPEADKPRPCN